MVWMGSTARGGCNLIASDCFRTLNQRNKMEREVKVPIDIAIHLKISISIAIMIQRAIPEAIATHSSQLGIKTPTHKKNY